MCSLSPVPLSLPEEAPSPAHFTLFTQWSLLILSFLSFLFFSFLFFSFLFFSFLSFLFFFLFFFVCVCLYCGLINSSTFKTHLTLLQLVSFQFFDYKMQGQVG